ncbi:hypothetical protein ACUXST_001472 [Sphingomonas sp. F9_3S_D5_B_2]
MSKPGKETVKLNPPVRVSRIRRDPVRTEEPQGLAGKINFSSSEWEITLAIIGMVVFALALNVIWLAVTSWVGK